MLDADNLFLQNTDELFQCGQFCAVFINPCIFHTGLFVLQVSKYYSFILILKQISIEDYCYSIANFEKFCLQSYHPLQHFCTFCLFKII